MIHLETSHVVNMTADFPDDFKIINGDGMVAIKNPATNEIVLQVPAASTIIYKRDNPQPGTPVPAAPNDVPPSMQADGEPA